MAKYSYIAINTAGKQKKGTLDASSQQDANAQLNAKGLMPTKVVLSDQGEVKAAQASTKKTKKASGFGRIIKSEELCTFTRQLATLIQAGLPLLKALEVLIRQEKNQRFKEVLEKICEQVRSGNTFSDGIKQHPKVFDRLFVNMVRAGEAGGVLDVVLARLATFMEKALKTQKKVKSAMVYPLVVVFVAVVIVTLLMVFVVPKFQTIFDDMLDGAALPAPTQFVIGISHFVRDNILLTLILLVAVYFASKFLLKTKAGSRYFDLLSIKLPKVGDLVSKVNIARITRTFGTLLSSGVPILQAITITKDITGNCYFHDAISRVHDSVRDGEALAVPMERESVFPNMVTSMIDVGEETGELSEMLNRIADNYDEDVDNAVAGITSIIEPVMIVFLALVVGFIVIALFLPIVEIIKQLTG